MTLAEVCSYHAGQLVAGELTVTSNLNLWANESFSPERGFLHRTSQNSRHQLSVTIISTEFRGLR